MLSRTNSNGLLVFFKFMFNFDWTKKKGNSVVSCY